MYSTEIPDEQQSSNSLTLLTLQVKTLAGNLPPIELFDSETVLGLKRILQSANPNFTYQLQRLSIRHSSSGDFESMNIDTRTLRSYGVTSESEISLVMFQRQLPEYNVRAFIHDLLIIFDLLLIVCNCWSSRTLILQ
jgi:hypothetical protein